MPSPKITERVHDLNKAKAITVFVRKTFKKRTFLKWTCLFLLGFLLRLLVSSFGSTFDFDSYKLVYESMIEGTLPWETRRYNYGSVWAAIILCAGKISMLQAELFRFVIILVLCTADWINSRFIMKYFSSRVSLFYYLNPISIMISGYYNQFDTLAIALCIVAIGFILKYENSKSNRDLALSVFFLTLSLSTKHIFAIFLIWLFFRYRGRERYILSVLPLILYLLHFVPFALLGKSRIIWEQVFLYWSANNAPFWRFFVRSEELVNSIGDHNAWHHGRLWMLLFLTAMICVGVGIRNVRLEVSLAIYTVSLVIFASAITTQFYAIAVFGVFCLFNPAFLYFIIVGSLLSITGPNGPLQHSESMISFPISAWDFPPHALTLGILYAFFVRKNSMYQS